MRKPVHDEIPAFGILSDCNKPSGFCDATPILQQAVILHGFPRIKRLTLVATAALLGACAPGASGTGPLSPSITPSPAAPTSTIVWFPATSTATPGPIFAPEPTPDMKPDVGQLLLADDFSVPAHWNTASSNLASVALDSNHLTIAVQPGTAPVVSFRVGQVFSDMYAEVTAQPSLCRGGDDYGLVFRAPNNVAYYRFALACNGTVGADRISLASIRVLQAPISSADAPPGAPGQVRLGVWAVGQEFRFFLNGHYQFSAEDKSYASGAIGVFAHAAGPSPVTVTFSDLAIYSVAKGPAITPQAP